MRWQPRTIDIIAIAFTVGYFLVLTIAMVRGLPTENKEVLSILLGLLSAVMLKIVEALFNKDSSNSATATTIRAMQGNPTEAPGDQK